jgi:hypothetical protein
MTKHRRSVKGGRPQAGPWWLACLAMGMLFYFAVAYDLQALG